MESNPIEQAAQDPALLPFLEPYLQAVLWLEDIENNPPPKTPSGAAQVFNMSDNFERTSQRLLFEISRRYPKLNANQAVIRAGDILFEQKGEDYFRKLPRPQGQWEGFGG